MDKPKVLLLGVIEHAQQFWSSLAEFADLVATDATNREDFIAQCRAGSFDGVLAIYDRAPSSMAVTGRFDKDLIGALPPSLRFLCHNGAGYDSIDITACSARNILVSNCPNVVENATADTAIFLILAALRGFNNGIMAVRNGTWKSKVPPPPLGHDPAGKILGILGMGGIGRNLKRKAESLGMRVMYHNRTRLSGDLAGDAEYVSFDELLAASDVLSLNIPLNSNTENLIAEKEFHKMKPGIVLINTARGGIMDEDALVNAISEGRVRSVGLDVYQQEPNVHPGLLANPYVCLLPHMGTSTVETKTAMEEWSIDNVRSALLHGRLKSVVPEQQSLVTA